jgi:hypothetical protein
MGPCEIQKKTLTKEGHIFEEGGMVFKKDLSGQPRDKRKKCFVREA